MIKYTKEEMKESFNNGYKQGETDTINAILSFIVCIAIVFAISLLIIII